MEIVNQLKKLRFVDAIFLFGSKARGTARPYSDTDLCVFAGKATDAQKKKILSFNDKNVDVVIFHELPLPIQATVFREGKQLFMRRDNAVRDAKYYTIKRYLDFLPTLQRQMEAILAP